MRNLNKVKKSELKKPIQETLFFSPKSDGCNKDKIYICDNCSHLNNFKVSGIFDYISCPYKQSGIWFPKKFYKNDEACNHFEEKEIIYFE